MLSTYFGFEKEPFSSAVDPAFFYAHASIKALSGRLLLSRLSERKGLTLIVGEAGVGKTALLSNILEQDRASDVGIYLSCGQDWSFATLLDRWCDGLGVRDPASGQEARIHAVIDLLSERSKGNATSTLLLDQAENLADDALEGISECAKIQTGKRALVQIILAARPAIDDRLDQAKLHNVARGIAFRTRLEPIGDSEIGAYVRHRLRVAGYEGPPLFPDDAVAAIAKASRGIAAHVNLLCHTALQLAELEQEKAVTAATAEQAVRVCTNHVQDRPGGQAGTVDRPSRPRTNQRSGESGPDAFGDDRSLVVLSLKKRSRSDDSIWPIRIGPDPNRAAGALPKEALKGNASKGPSRVGNFRLAAASTAIALMIAAAAWYLVPMERYMANSPNTAEPRSIGHEQAPAIEPPLKTARAPQVPRLVVVGAEGREDQAIALEIELSGIDESVAQRLALTLSGFPAGMTPSAGSPRADGAWSLEPGALSGLTLFPPTDYSGSFEGEITAALVDSANGDDISVTAALAVTVNGVADTPFLETVDATGMEDEPIALDIRAALADTDGSEKLAILLEGLPEGATLSAGRNNGRGGWTLAADRLGGLQLVPPKDFSGAFQITARATAREAGNLDEATAIATPTVTVLGVADPPRVETADVRGNEDQAIPLDILASLVDRDGSETLEVLLSGVPEGALLSSGEQLRNGTWKVGVEQLPSLALVPPKNSSGAFLVTVEAMSRERDSGDRSVSTEHHSVTVASVADRPMLTVRDAVGREDLPIPLDIRAGLADQDGSEALTVLLDGLPEGARLSAGTVEDNGQWVLVRDQLPGLELLPPENFSGGIQVTVDAIAQEKDGDKSAKATRKLSVAVAEVADPPHLAVKDAKGQAEQPIPLTVRAGVSDLDGSEKLTVSLAGLPVGARLSAGEADTEGNWILTAEQLPDLKLLPPTDFDGAFEVTARATTLETGGDRASLSAPFKVWVAAAAQTPETLEKATEDIKTPAISTPDPVAPPPKLSADRWTARGDELLALGDVVSARLFYELALDHGKIEAGTSIAKTYDPLYLTGLGLRQRLGDKAVAIEWYQRAIEAGDSEAVPRLKDLTASPE